MSLSGARDRNRTGMPVIHEAADFKSDVSTYFTTRAQLYCGTKKPRTWNLRGLHEPISAQLSGGATQSRTGLDGFAIRCITDLLSRQKLLQKREAMLPFFKFGAGKESRTLDLNLGKVALYQLSYSRVASP